MTFHNINNLRLEVEATPTGLINMVKNPDGNKGAWFYITPVNNTAITAIADGLVFSTSVSQAAYFTTGLMPVTATTWVAGRFDLIALTASHNIKVRWEWVKADGTALSSTTQSSAITSLGTTYVASAQAPTDAAFVRLRFDFYKTTNPDANASLTFTNVMVTKNSANAFSTVRKNVVPNPSIETGGSGAGWFVNQNCTIGRMTAQVYSGTYSLGITSVAAGLAEARNGIGTGGFAITGGKTYSLSAYFRSAAAEVKPRLGIFFYDSSGKGVGAYGIDGSTLTTTSWLRHTMNVTAPSSAVWTTIALGFQSTAANQVVYADGVLLEDLATQEDTNAYFDGSFASAGSLTYAWTGTAHSSVSTETNTAFAYAEPTTWVNVLGPTSNINITRNALDIGTLNADILDSLLDPASTDILAKGKKIRLVADPFGTNAFDDVFYTGTISNAKVSYTVDKSTRADITRISLSALDNVSTLANSAESRGVGTAGELPYLLEGRAVPYSILGSGNQVPTATIVSSNDNASLLDQIVVTRDTNKGYAYVDKQNVFTYISAPTAAFQTFTDVPFTEDAYNNSYTDIDVEYDTDAFINEVNIKWLRYNTVTKETVEVAYGPYRNQASIDANGLSSVEFTVQGAVENATMIASWAQGVLTANAVPVIKPNNLTVYVDNAKRMHNMAAIDLYSAQTIKFRNKVNGDYAVTGITHDISPDKWLVTLQFANTDAVATPTTTPSPATTSQVDYVPIAKVHITDTTDANTAAGNSPPLLIGDAAGQHLRIDGNEILAMQTASSQNALYLNPGGVVIVDYFQNLSPAGRNTAGTAQTIATSNWSLVALSNDFTRGDLSASSSGFIANVAGYYAVSGNLEWASNTTGRRLLRIEKFTTEAVSAGTTICGDERGSIGLARQSISGFVYLNVGDRIRLIAWQSSGANLSTIANVANLGIYMV